LIADVEQHHRQLLGIHLDERALREQRRHLLHVRVRRWAIQERLSRPREHGTSVAVLHVGELLAAAITLDADDVPAIRHG
jgi:hypothetical protein